MNFENKRKFQMHTIHTIPLQKHFPHQGMYFLIHAFLYCCFLKNLQTHEWYIFSSTRSCFLCYVLQAVNVNSSCIKPQGCIHRVTYFSRSVVYDLTSLEQSSMPNPGGDFLHRDIKTKLYFPNRRRHAIFLQIKYQRISK